jgi:hypothetical protein
MDAHVQVGRVSFQTPSSPAARESINRGLSLFYSFWYDEARKSFVEAARLDSRCAVAYWGQAISYYQPVETLPEGGQLRHGREAIVRAQSAASQSRRERGYIEALQFIFDSDSEPGARATRYSDAMGKLAAAYPKDNVAALLFALSLLSPELPDDPDHIRSRKAVTILNAILRAEPDNPGVTHFIIHACDNPAMAKYGLEAARRYSTIAPASAHALHMPGHIFARLGLWQDDIQSNLASKTAAENVSIMHTGAQHRFHAMEFLQYAYLQIGREDKARAIADEAQTIQASELDPGFESYYGWIQESLKVRLALETRDWSGAMELRPNSGTGVFVQRLNYWAKAVAAGHVKNRAAAEVALNGYEGTFSEAQLLEETKNHFAQLAETRAWTADRRPSG